MEKILFAALENSMDNWVQNNCSEDWWPDGYVYNDLATDMAKAAALVFDANIKGQEFADNERGYR